MVFNIKYLVYLIDALLSENILNEDDIIKVIA